MDKTCKMVLAYCYKSKSSQLKMLFKIQIRKATSFKSLRVNWWEINQVASKCQINFFGQNLQKNV